MAAFKKYKMIPLSEPSSSNTVTIKGHNSGETSAAAHRRLQARQSRKDNRIQNIFRKLKNTSSSLWPQAALQDQINSILRNSELAPDQKIQVIQSLTHFSRPAPNKHKTDGAPKITVVVNTTPGKDGANPTVQAAATGNQNEEVHIQLIEPEKKDNDEDETEHEDAEGPIKAEDNEFQKPAPKELQVGNLFNLLNTVGAKQKQMANELLKLFETEANNIDLKINNNRELVLDGKNVQGSDFTAIFDYLYHPSRRILSTPPSGTRALGEYLHSRQLLSHFFPQKIIDALNPHTRTINTRLSLNNPHATQEGKGSRPRKIVGYAPFRSSSARAYLKSLNLYKL